MMIPMRTMTKMKMIMRGKPRTANHKVTDMFGYGERNTRLHRTSINDTCHRQE